MNFGIEYCNARYRKWHRKLSNQPVIGQVQALTLFMIIHNNSLRNVRIRNL